MAKCDIFNLNERLKFRNKRLTDLYRLTQNRIKVRYIFNY